MSDVSDRDCTLTDNAAKALPRRARRRARFFKPLVGLLLVGLLGGLVVGTSAERAAADTVGGTGGVPGGSYGGGGSLNVRSAFLDDWNMDGTPVQGYGQASINYFRGVLGLNGKYMGDTAAQQACSTALSEATSRGGGTPSRVVGLVWAELNGNYGGNAYRSSPYFYDEINEWVANGLPGVVTGGGRSQVAGLAKTAVQNVSGHAEAPKNYSTPYVTLVCIALSDGESPPPNYDLSITTDATNTFAVAGGTSPVHDTIHASRNGSSITENATGTVVMHWDGLTDAVTWNGVTNAATSRSKAVTIANQGDTASPTFSPSDFGWTVWPSGSYWFDVQVPKQGGMNAAVDTPDRQVSETWTAATPSYPLAVTTDASGTFATAGSATPVHDAIYATNGGSPVFENLSANVIMHWDGLSDAITWNGVTNGATQRTKAVSIVNSGSTNSPQFTPSDFGWTVWPSGSYWFDVQVPRQGFMVAAVDAADHDPRESWLAATPLYGMTVTTTATNTFATAGGSAPVRDTLHVGNGGSPVLENVTATVVLHWDGLIDPISWSGVTNTATSRAKTVSISNTGDTVSPTFTPADFGWTVWPSGRYWFDVQVAKQGFMTAAVDTPDRQPSETWIAATPAYSTTVTTTATDVFSTAGEAGSVYDILHVDNGGSPVRQNATASVVLHWDGVVGFDAASSTKTMTLANNGEQASPAFTPADFGWSTWAPGTYWFDVQAPQQGFMSAAVDTPDREASETWVAQTPLVITTDATNTFAMSGGTETVCDMIHADNGGADVVEDYSFTVILHWDGLSGGPVDHRATASTKTAVIPNQGDTCSPDFTPGDFGWAAWAPGQYWYDIQVAKQSFMRDAVDTLDYDERELWVAEAPLTITTDAKNTFDLAGATNAVYDTIHAESGDDSIVEQYKARVTLNWDGVGTYGARAVSKAVTIASSGDTDSPTFTPGDFGWSVWGPGRYWFDVEVAKQSHLSAAVDTPDREVSETWIAETPLTITTDARDFPATHGTTTIVHDSIHANNGGSSIKEDYQATVTLHWDTSATGSDLTVSKDVTFTNRGDTPSRTFVPADFGWETWPLGVYWFDVQVAQQSFMTGAVDTPDRDERETWVLGYRLGIKTDAQNTFVGSNNTGPVYDLIHANNYGSTISEDVTADVVLHWDGAAEGADPKSVSKAVVIANSGDTASPEFTPADFGWVKWPDGTYWFDVTVARQGLMAAAVDTPDREARELWTTDGEVGGGPGDPTPAPTDGPVGPGEPDVAISGAPIFIGGNPWMMGGGAAALLVALIGLAWWWRSKRNRFGQSRQAGARDGWQLPGW